LPHPDQEAIATDDDDGDDRPYPERQDEKSQQLGTSFAAQIMAAGRFERVLYHRNTPSTSDEFSPRKAALRGCAATFGSLFASKSKYKTDIRNPWIIVARKNASGTY
jgi:hypothetical protein